MNSAKRRRCAQSTKTERLEAASRYQTERYELMEIVPEPAP